MTVPLFLPANLVHRDSTTKWPSYNKQEKHKNFVFFPVSPPTHQIYIHFYQHISEDNKKQEV